jgi:hypothetical protein
MNFQGFLLESPGANQDSCIKEVSHGTDDLLQVVSSPVVQDVLHDPARGSRRAIEQAGLT